MTLLLDEIALATVLMLARMLLLSSLSPDIAAARGVPVRAVAVANTSANVRGLETGMRALSASASRRRSR